jgi:hypothetical protein
MGTGLEVFLIASVVGTTGVSLYSQSKAASAQKKGIRAQNAAKALEDAVRRRQEFKAYRKAAAEGQQQLENSGVAGSSAQGAGESARSQFNANLSFLDQTKALGDFAGSMFERATKYSNAAQTAQGIGSMASAFIPTAQAAGAAEKATRASVEAGYRALPF